MSDFISNTKTTEVSLPVTAMCDECTKIKASVFVVVNHAHGYMCQECIGKWNRGERDE